MKFWLSLFLSLSFCSVALAAELETERGLYILAVNGEVEGFEDYSSPLSQGSNQVVIQVNRKVGKGNSASVFKSKPYVLTFEAAASDTISIKGPKLYSYEGAKRTFSSDPEWVVTKNGKETEFTSVVLPSVSTVLPDFAIERSLKEFNKSKIVDTAVPSDNAKVLSAPAMPVEQTTGAVLNQLKALYEAASPEERKSFRRWIVDYE